MTKTINYTCAGTCAKHIAVELDGDVVLHVEFDGGCHGNHQGINALVHGMKASEVIARLEGIDCRGRGTSCPDQLAKALREAL